MHDESIDILGVWRTYVSSDILLSSSLCVAVSHKTKNVYKNYFCPGKYSFSHIKFVVILLDLDNFCNFFDGIKRLFGCHNNQDGYGTA